MKPSYENIQFLTYSLEQKFKSSLSFLFRILDKLGSFELCKK